jgi:mycoredoxin
MSTSYIPEAGSITMFSTTWCGYCRRLKTQLDKVGIGYTEINIEDVPGTAELVAKINGGNQTVPTLLYSDGTSATNPSLAQVQAAVATAAASAN